MNNIIKIIKLITVLLSQALGNIHGKLSITMREKTFIILIQKINLQIQKIKNSKITPIPLLKFLI